MSLKKSFKIVTVWNCSKVHFSGISWILCSIVGNLDPPNSTIKDTNGSKFSSKLHYIMFHNTLGIIITIQSLFEPYYIPKASFYIFLETPFSPLKDHFSSLAFFRKTNLSFSVIDFWVNSALKMLPRQNTVPFHHNKIFV